ncbi:MAG: HEAT repeat domain-containing protein, partial [Planctomycetes bacterium]|nr:HEAT repeat domain-containing protein [Planctomycetota bacterium]
ALTKVPDPAAAPIAASRLDDRKHQTRRSAAILAGYVIPASDQKAMRQFIRTVADESDQHAQNFGIISIGRLGGDDAVKWLVHALEKERHRETRAFAALALGIAKNTDSAPALREAVATEKDETLRGAAAVALGILGDRDSAETILKVLKEERNPELRADLVTALGMLEFEGATEFVRELLGEARNRRLVQACGLFLAVVNDSSSIDLMLRVMRHSGSIQVKGGMATAIGRMADRRSIEELVKLVKDGSETDQTRAFALVALGLIADQADVSAFARISIDSNYALDDAQALLEAIDIF